MDMREIETSAFLALEKRTSTDKFTSRTIKKLDYMMDLRLRASPRHSGQGVF
jgi:hypothetical protein